jgi:hypothetical protein
LLRFKKASLKYSPKLTDSFVDCVTILESFWIIPDFLAVPSNEYVFD